MMPLTPGTRSHVPTMMNKSLWLKERLYYIDNQVKCALPLRVTLASHWGWSGGDCFQRPHQSEEWPWCGIMTLCEEQVVWRGPAADSCSMKSCLDILLLISRTHLLRISHGGIRRTFKFYSDKTKAISNNPEALKCPFSVFCALGQQCLSDSL